MMHSIKRRTKNIEVPDLKDSTKLITGFRHYNEMCVICHSAPGIKESEFARGLYPEPPEFKNHEKIPGPAGAYWIIKNGIKITGMPAFSPTHKEKDLWAILAFLVNRLPGMTEADYTSMNEKFPSNEE